MVADHQVDQHGQPSQAAARSIVCGRLAVMGQVASDDAQRGVGVVRADARNAPLKPPHRV